jgi:hypothetical protein
VSAVDLSFEEGKEGATDAPSALSLVMITARVNVPYNACINRFSEPTGDSSNLSNVRAWIHASL